MRNARLILKVFINKHNVYSLKPNTSNLITSHRSLYNTNKGDFKFFDESNHSNIAASVKVGSICAEVHNGADEATLAALFRVLKSC